MFLAVKKRIEQEDKKQDVRIARICMYLNLLVRKPGEVVYLEEFMPGYEAPAPRGLTYEEFKARVDAHNASLAGGAQ